MPALASGESGIELSFEGSSDGQSGVEASLQANLNGVWQEVSSGVLGGSGGVLTLASGDLPAGSALKLVVKASQGTYVDMGGLVYTTITKAVQTYMALSCDTDAAWNDGYRYGFNGQVKDEEIAGKGNHNTATFWELDTRLGRRWNLDPVDQIGISNYAVNRLNPIVFNDPSGNDPLGKKKNGHESGMPGSGTSADLPDVVIRSTRTGGARTAAGLDDALDGYVARKSAMDNTPLSERTGNKYDYAVYQLQRDRERSQADARQVHEKWAASYEQTSNDITRFGLIMIGSAATIAVSAPMIGAGGTTLLTEKFFAGSIGNLAGQVLTAEGDGIREKLMNVNWTGVFYAGAANPWAAEIIGSTFKLTINDRFNTSLVSTNEQLRMSNGAWLLNVGATGVVGDVNNASVDMSGIWKYSGLRTTLSLFGYSGGRIVRIGYGTTINTMFNSGANTIQNVGGEELKKH